MVFCVTSNYGATGGTINLAVNAVNFLHVPNAFLP